MPCRKAAAIIPHLAIFGAAVAAQAPKTVPPLVMQDGPMLTVTRTAECSNEVNAVSVTYNWQTMLPEGSTSPPFKLCERRSALLSTDITKSQPTSAVSYAYSTPEVASQVEDLQPVTIESGAATVLSFYKAPGATDASYLRSEQNLFEEENIPGQITALYFKIDGDTAGFQTFNITAGATPSKHRPLCAGSSD